MAKNESKNPSKEYSVGGYTFKTKEGAQAAKDELAAIKYMSSKTLLIAESPLLFILIFFTLILISKQLYRKDVMKTSAYAAISFITF